MNEFNLDDMNISLYAGLYDGEVQNILDERYNFIGKCVKDHGNVPDDKFYLMYNKENTKGHIWGLVLNELSGEILQKVSDENSKNY